MLNFVGNEALSEEKVSSLLKQRSESARAVAQTYGFIADYIEMADHHGLFEVSQEKEKEKLELLVVLSRV